MLLWKFSNSKDECLYFLYVSVGLAVFCVSLWWLSTTLANKPDFLLLETSKYTSWCVAFCEDFSRECNCMTVWSNCQTCSHPRASNTVILSRPLSSHPDAQGTLKVLCVTRKTFLPQCFSNTCVTWNGMLSLGTKTTWLGLRKHLVSNGT